MLYSLLIRRLLRPGRPAALLLLVLLSTTAALAATLTLFTATYEGSTARVEWEVSSETDITGFELYRKGATETSYTMVSNIMPTGQRRYYYLDTNMYRMASGTTASTESATITSGPFSYRLTIRNRNTGTDQSYVTILAGTPSTVQRSWGTIKSMFR